MAKANPIDEAKELQQMLTAYAKQETVDPLKTLGKYLGFGVAGSILVFMGMLFVGLGTLRFLQTNVEAFEGGSWGSTAPYAITLAVLVVMIVLLMAAYSRARKAIS